MRGGAATEKRDWLRGRRRARAAQEDDGKRDRRRGQNCCRHHHQQRALGLRCGGGRRRVRHLREPLQLQRDIVRALNPVGRICHQAGAQQPVERDGRRRLQRRHRRRLSIQNRRNQARLRFALESLSTGEHLVQHCTEGKDVGPRIGVLPLELLGRHVLERAEDRSVAGQFGWRSGERREAGLRSCREDFRQPEIEELGLH
jgi:hypothetical protein